MDYFNYLPSKRNDKVPENMLQNKQRRIVLLTKNGLDDEIIHTYIAGISPEVMRMTISITLVQ